MNDRPRKAADDEELEVRELLHVVVLSFTDVGQFDPHRLFGTFAAIRDVTSQTSQSIVVLNLRMIKLLNSEALDQLAGLSRELKATKRTLRLCHVQPVIQDVLQITGLVRFFDVVPDVTAATSQ